MIKINLLPVRAAKRKEAARQQAVILVGAIICVVLIGVAIYFYLLLKISATRDEIFRSEQELVELKAKIGKINDLEKLKAEVTKKLEVLNHLRKERTGPVKRMLALSQAVPDKLWLNDYDESEQSVVVKGLAFSEEHIAAFMRNLESSPEFNNVELIYSEQIEMSGLKMKKFEIKFNIETQKASVSTK